MVDFIELYCDEAGFTGSNLLDADQTFFVYACVNIPENIKKEFIRLINLKYKEASKKLPNELKGSKLLKTKIGKEIILEIFKKYSSYAKIVYHDKKLALAAFIIDYGIEPILPDEIIQSVDLNFYENNFNKFLVYSLYNYFNAEQGKQLMKELYEVFNNKKLYNDSILSSPSILNTIDKKRYDTIIWIIKMLQLNSHILFNKEGNFIFKEDNKWFMDLTIESLYGLSIAWSVFNKPLKITCDKSNALEKNKEVDIYNKLGKKLDLDPTLNKIKYILYDSLKIDDSVTNTNLQIADIFASTVFYCLNNNQSNFCNKIMKITIENAIPKPNDFCIIYRPNQFYYFNIAEYLFLMNTIEEFMEL